MQNRRDLLRAKKAIDQVTSDLERRKMRAQGCEPGKKHENKPVEIIPPTRPKAAIVQVLIQQPSQKRFSREQTCCLGILAGVLFSLLLCGGLLALPSIIGQPPDNFRFASIPDPTRRP